ncbi:helix-turn-helix domain-containing protein [Streptacidiphilus sp. EB103A]|uniref:helix-turn-helix domain-containing protein n=1 Tax=Streptacidiphilus sp. EB103A TaxID=3156275 RepID=UPI003512E4BB
MTQYLHGERRAALVAQASKRYAAGLTIRQVAAEIGYSYCATRNMLIRAGVELRPRPRGLTTESPQQKHDGGRQQSTSPAGAATTDRHAA